MKRHYSQASSLHGKHRIVNCSTCGTGVRSDKLTSHVKTYNPSKSCRFCKKQIRNDKILKHETLCRDKVYETLCNRTGAQRLESNATCSSVSGYFNSYERNVENSIDYDVLISRTLEATKVLLLQFLIEQPIKAQIVLILSFYRQPAGEKEVSDKVFRSICEPLLMGDD